MTNPVGGPQIPTTKLTTAKNTPSTAQPSNAPASSSAAEPRITQVGISTLDQAPPQVEPQAEKKGFLGKFKDGVAAMAKGGAAKVHKVGQAISNAAHDVVEDLEQKFGLIALSKMIDHESDKKQLALILKDPADIEKNIQQISPKLTRMIPVFLPDYAELVEKDPVKSQDLLNKLLFHVVTNLAVSQLPPEAQKELTDKKKIPEEQKLSQAELARKLSLQLVDLLGNTFNEIDKHVVEEKEEPALQMFVPVAEKLSNLIFPKSNGFIEKKANALIQPKLAKALMEGYARFVNWIDKKDVAKAPDNDSKDGLDLDEMIDPLKGDLERFGLFMVETMGLASVSSDMQVLEKLTGSSDIKTIVQKLSPEVMSFVTQLENLPEALKSLILKNNKTQLASLGMTEVVLVKAIACMASEVFANELKEGKLVPIEQLIPQLTSYFCGTMKKAFDDADAAVAAGQPLTAGLFAPLSAKLVELVLPKEPFLRAFIERRKEKLCGPINKELLSVYKIKGEQKTIEVQKQRLRQLLWDPSRYANIPGSSGKVPEVPSEADSVWMGLEPTVDQLYNLCTNVVSVAKNEIAETLLDPKLFHEDHSSKSKSVKASLPKDLLAKLQAGMKGVVEGENGDVEWMSAQIQGVAGLTLFKGLVNLLSKVPVENRSPRERLLSEVFKILMSSGLQHLPNGHQQFIESVPAIKQAVVEKYSKQASPDYIANNDKRAEQIVKEQKAQVQKLAEENIAPFVDELIYLFFVEQKEGGQFEDQIPLPDPLKSTGAKAIRGGMIKLIGKMMVSSTAWHRDREANSAKLEKQYGSHNPQKFCHILGKMAQEGLPYALREENQKLTDKVLDKLKPLLMKAAENADNEEQQPGNKETDVKFIKSMLSNLLKFIGHDTSPEMKQMLGYVGVFTETALLKMVADLSSSLDAMEKDLGPEDDSLIEKAAIYLVEELRDHFAVIAGAKKALKKKHKEDIPREELIKQFEHAGHLHPAVKDGAAKTEFYQDWSEKLFKLMGISEAGMLPVPEFLQSKVMEVLNEELMPKLLALLFSNAIDPHNLNKALIQMLDQVNASMDGPAPVTDEERRRFKDAYQTKLEQQIGLLTSALVEMQPSSKARWIMRTKKMRANVGEAIGQPVRLQMYNDAGEKRSLFEVLNVVMGKVADILQPSTYDEATKTFTYQQELPDNQTVNIAEPSLSRFFPRTEAEKQLNADVEKTERIRVEKKVPEELKKVVWKQTRKIYKDMVKNAWQKFENWVDRVILKIFRKYAANVKKILMPFLRVVIGLPMKLVLLIIYALIWLPISAILTFMVLRADARGKDIKLGIHDNLFYRLMGTTMAQMADELEKNKQNAMKAPPMPDKPAPDVLANDDGNKAAVDQVIDKALAKGAAPGPVEEEDDEDDWMV